MDTSNQFVIRYSFCLPSNKIENFLTVGSISQRLIEVCFVLETGVWTIPSILTELGFMRSDLSAKAPGFVNRCGFQQQIHAKILIRLA
jgi:hypothetical protein